MTMPYNKLLTKVVFWAAISGLLAACTPPPTIPQQTGNLNLDMRRMQSALDRQAQALQSLNDQMAEIRETQQQQAAEIEQLRQQPVSTRSGYNPAELPQTNPVTTASIPTEGSPTEVYLQSFGDYASGRYQAAIRGFGSFLQRFPNNSYASNAQFWLADSYFNQQQYATAIQEFNRVISDYQNAPKNPDALYKIAIAYLQLGSSDEARDTIELLNRRYPDSTATQKAQELVIP